MTDMLDQLHHKENEIARLLTENIQLRRKLESKTAPDAAMNLKPCPFCDELPSVRDDAAIVCCRNKECDVRPAVSRVTREAAVAAWNKRPNQQMP